VENKTPREDYQKQSWNLSNGGRGTAQRQTQSLADFQSSHSSGQKHAPPVGPRKLSHSSSEYQNPVKHERKSHTSSQGHSSIHSNKKTRPLPKNMPAQEFIPPQYFGGKAFLFQT